MSAFLKVRLATALAVAGAALVPAAARAAGPPQVTATWVTGVTAVTGDLQAEINPNGAATGFHFEYIAEAAYEANVAAARPPFSGAARAPLAGEPSAGSGAIPVAVLQRVALFKAATAYRYRVVAKSAEGETAGPTRRLRTRPTVGGSMVLPDGRGWELVSPAAKGAAAVGTPGSLFDGGVFQAAPGGDAFTYSTAGAFGGGAGAPPASQYLAVRTASAWLSQSLDPPLLSGSYPDLDEGVPYRLFSEDLSLGLLSNGQRCRGLAGDCAVANPPLAGSGAPAGYRNYYLRSTSGGAQGLLTAPPPLAPEQFEVSFAGATPDLSQVVLSSCAALTAEAIEVPNGEGCDEARQNLYLRSAGGLRAINLLPAQAQTSPGAALAAPAGAISAAGERVYFSHEGDLYLREGGATKQVDAALGGGGEFQTASDDGSVAYFTKEGHLYRYAAAADEATDLTPAGGVEGVLGASADGAYVYYLTASGLFLRHGATTTAVAPAADAANYPPATGSARVSTAGTRLAFVSSALIGEYDNGGMAQVYLYDATADRLRCISCNQTGARPAGPSTIPGANPNGFGPTALYKPRALSADGRRIFFDSLDALVPQDSDARPDVYEWEEQGSGSCQEAGGCVFLISGGRLLGGSFVDADADGSDVFFASADSLLARDPDGALDLYDARVGGGQPDPAPPIPCNGDECQGPAPAPEDPVPVTATLRGPVNPPVRFAAPKKKGRKCAEAKGKKRCGKPRHGKGKAKGKGGERAAKKKGGRR